MIFLVIASRRFANFFFSLGIFVCEILNGSIPFLDKAPTLILLEKLKGSQPLVMDRTTLEEAHGEAFEGNWARNLGCPEKFYFDPD